MRNHLFQQLDKANLMNDTAKDVEFIHDCIMDSCDKCIPKCKPCTKNVSGGLIKMSSGQFD